MRSAGEKIISRAMVSAFILLALALFAACGSPVPSLKEMTENYSGRLSEQALKEAGFAGLSGDELNRAWGEPYSFWDDSLARRAWREGEKWVVAGLNLQDGTVTDVTVSVTLRAVVAQVVANTELLVRPIGEPDDPSSAERIVIHKSWLAEKDAAAVTVGTELTLEYDGERMETFPEQISRPYSIAVTGFREAEITAADGTGTKAGQPSAQDEAEAAKKTGQAPETIDIGKRYYVSEATGGEYSVNRYLDRTGKLTGEQSVPQPLCDVITGELRYWTLTEYPPYDGEPLFDPITAQRPLWCALYTADGRLLQERTDCVFANGVGPYVRLLKLHDAGEHRSGDAYEHDDGVLQEDTSWLYDPVEDRILYTGVQGLMRLTDKTALMIDTEYHIRSVIDREGKETARWEGEPVRAGYVRGGYICSDTGMLLLNERLERVDTATNGFDIELLDCGAQGIWYMKRSGEQKAVVCADSGERFGPFPKEELQATDGLRVIRGHEFEEDYRLCDLQGEPLTKTYDEIRLLLDENEIPTGRYLARRDRTVYILGADGAVLYENRLDALQVDKIYSEKAGRIGCQYTYENPDTGYKDWAVKVFDAALNDLFPAEHYQWIDKTGMPGVWLVSWEEGESSYCSALLDESGKELYRDAVLYGSSDEDAIALVDKDGKTVGLIDRDGKWIGRDEYVPLGKKQEQQ